MYLGNIKNEVVRSRPSCRWYWNDGRGSVRVWWLVVGVFNFRFTKIKSYKQRHSEFVVEDDVDEWRVT